MAKKVSRQYLLGRRGHVKQDPKLEEYTREIIRFNFAVPGIYAIARAF